MERKEVKKVEDNKTIKTHVKKEKVKEQKNNLKIFRHPIIKLFMNLLFVASACLLVSSGICMYDNVMTNLNISLFIIGIVLLILSSIYICRTCGKNMKGEKIHFIFFDNIYLEVISIIEFIIGYGYVNLIMELIDMAKNNSTAKLISTTDLIIKSSTYTALFAIATLILIKPIIKHSKNNSLIVHSIIGNIVYGIIYLFKKIYLEGSMYKRYVVSVFSIFIIAIFGTPGLCLAFLITIFAAITYVLDFNNAIHSIRKYNDSNAIKNKNKDLNELLSEVELIKDDVSKMVNEKLDGEKNKMNIILSSVHDLSLPLDSVLESVNKLCENGNYDKETQKQIESIKNRITALRAFQNDVLQKSNLLDGNIDIQLEKIDMFSFITKGLTEVEEDIKNSNISFKLNIRKQKINVYADRHMLWRIVENLISDVYKHTHKGARVFLEIDELGDYALISMKNEVKEKDNMSKEQFNEKYFMKDKGITSLNVARNLASVQNGSLTAQIIDGMFEVDVKIPLYKKEI